MLIRVLLNDVDEVVLYKDNDTEHCSLLFLRELQIGGISQGMDPFPVGSKVSTK